ncbi:MAG: hypothetical protein KDI55_15305, partial [Anaerolineae bacterium]|nr:hypothetical protein [Anaerolineae bacterium]
MQQRKQAARCLCNSHGYICRSRSGGGAAVAQCHGYGNAHTDDRTDGNTDHHANINPNANRY